MREEQANMSTQVTDVSNVSEVEIEAEIQMLSVGERRLHADFIMMRSKGNLL